MKRGKKMTINRENILFIVDNSQQLPLYTSSTIKRRDSFDLCYVFRLVFNMSSLYLRICSGREEKMECVRPEGRRSAMIGMNRSDVVFILTPFLSAPFFRALAPFFRSDIPRDKTRVEFKT